jgi:ATP-dependent RNA helicase MSS116, mitochondrial
VSTLLKPNHETVSTIPKGETNVHERIPQYHYEAGFESHIDLVVTLIETHYSPKFKAVIFCQTAHLANLVHAVLSKCPLFTKSRNCFVQHSRQSQGARTKVTQQFKDCTVGVLVATDVVARGMDFPLVSHVFQMGVDSSETYVHRVGRTGRNGAEGTGFLILAPQESYLVPLLRKMNIPLKTERIEIVSNPFIIQAIAIFCSDSDNAKKVYQSWLGTKLYLI